METFIVQIIFHLTFLISLCITFLLTPIWGPVIFYPYFLFPLMSAFWTFHNFIINGISGRILQVPILIHTLLYIYKNCKVLFLFSTKSTIILISGINSSVPNLMFSFDSNNLTIEYSRKKTHTVLKYCSKFTQQQYLQRIHANVLYTIRLIISN